MSGDDALRELLARADALVEEARAAGAVDALRAHLRSAFDAPAVAAAGGEGRFGLIGDSEPMRAVFGLVEKVARSDVPVLILGETGTGKELVARALHTEGARARKPFLAVNCAAVPANLLESELFGHVRGAFTGAVADRPGHFAAANGGTLFLDEIGDMPIEMQAKLLRALQEGEVRAVGASKSRKVDVRVVAATHRDLAAWCKQGRFREDLYYRLAVVTIPLPPLREREGDVARLVAALVPRIARDLGRDLPTVSPEALERLERHRWPGNVRELENELRRAIALGGDALGPDDLSPAVRGA